MNDTAKQNGVAISLPETIALSQEQWREMCVQLLTDQKQLRREIAELRTQRQRLLDALFPEDAKEVTLSKEELFAQCVTEPPLDDFIDHLEKSLGSAPQ
jgi:hypothetical protein